MERRRILLRRIRLVLLFFMAALAASGITAVPLESELDILVGILRVPRDASPEDLNGLGHWIAKVRQGIHETNRQYPFMAYGTDWLAFAHVMIAVSFIGPLRDPVRNIWVIKFGLIACAAVIPTALIFGVVRGIPFYWQLIDCSFGLFGAIPLLLVWKWTNELEKESSASAT